MAMYSGDYSAPPPSDISQDVSDTATSMTGGLAYSTTPASTDLAVPVSTDLAVPVSTSSSINPNISPLIFSKENQTIEITSSNSLINSENTRQTILSLNSIMQPNSTRSMFNITFRANQGYYYSENPAVILNFPGADNYTVTTILESKNADNYIIEKEFEVKYNSTEFNVSGSDGHNFEFTSKVSKEGDAYIERNEIKKLDIDMSSISGDGESRNIGIFGTPGSTFSLTIKDKNNRNVLPYLNSITKTIKTAATASNILELDNVANLEVGMVVLNDQKRNVKITSITDPVKANVDTVTESTTTNISISSFLTFAVDAPVVFVKEAELTEVVIPDSGVYSFIQNFPALEKFKRTLKTAASSTQRLVLDYNDDLEIYMKMTGTGVDGNDTEIKTVDPNGVDITVAYTQTIADETELTFEMPDNRYDITLYPLKAILGDNVPTYSSDECDTLPTYSIYQYIDPIVQITPQSTLSNVTVDGTITLTDKANRGATGTSGDITISMTATKSDGNLEVSRNPRFSNTISTLSDFSNTLNISGKIVREDGCNDKDIVHLNNTTGIRAGMIVTGENIDTNKTIIVKSITGTAVKLSEKQTINKGDSLTFNSMFRMDINSLTATLSANGGLSTGVCTVTGTGKIYTFGIDSFISEFNFDNFLSISG